MDKKNKEIRSNNFEYKEEGNIVQGYAVVFESESEDLGGFVEVIHREAISQKTIDESDVFAKLNHNDNQILARSRNGKGSLKLEVDEIGLKYSFEIPNTIHGSELKSHLQRKEISQSSFAFTIPKKDPTAEKWEKRDGKTIRHIYKIDKLFDVSPVFTPAYETTSSYLRYQKLEETMKNVFAVLKAYEREIECL